MISPKVITFRKNMQISTMIPPKVRTSIKIMVFVPPKKRSRARGRGVKDQSGQALTGSIVASGPTLFAVPSCRCLARGVPFVVSRGGAVLKEPRAERHNGGTILFLKEIKK